MQERYNPLCTFSASTARLHRLRHLAYIFLEIYSSSRDFRILILLPRPDGALDSSSILHSSTSIHRRFHRSSDQHLAPTTTTTTTVRHRNTIFRFLSATIAKERPRHPQCSSAGTGTCSRNVSCSYHLHACPSTPGASQAPCLTPALSPSSRD